MSQTYIQRLFKKKKKVGLVLVPSLMNRLDSEKISSMPLGLESQKSGVQSKAASAGCLHRRVFVNEREVNARGKKFVSPTNVIVTSKYTWWSFLPKSLLLQFAQAANLFFLLTAVLQCISIISPLSPFLAIVPLFLVLFASLLREAYEDLVRENEFTSRGLLLTLSFLSLLSPETPQK